MKTLLIFTIFLMSGNVTLTHEADKALAMHKYTLAGRLYEKMAEENTENRDLIRWNAAMAYQKADSMEQALRLYQGLSRSANITVRSGSMNQTAVYLAENEKLQEALTLCKQALIENPDDEIARYNFEWIRRRLKTPPPPPPQQQEQEENQKQKQEKDTSKPSAPKPTEHLGSYTSEQVMSYEQARAELEKLESKEKKFIQQLRKKIKGRPARSGTPEI